MTDRPPATPVMKVWIAGHGWEEFPDADGFAVRPDGTLMLFALDHEQQAVRHTVAIRVPDAWRSLANAEASSEVPMSRIGFLREPPDDDLDDQPSRW